MPSLGRVIDPLQLLPPATRLLAAAGTAAASAAARASLELLDRALATPLAAQAGERVVRSAAAEQALRVALDGPLARLLADPATGRLLDRALDSPRTAELADRLLASAGMERLVAQAVDSRLMETGVARLLESESLWLAVEQIARSPAVTEAIAHQGAGFADQVAGEVGERTRRADARLERTARRLLRRRPPPADPGAGAEPPFAPPQAP